MKTTAGWVLDQKYKNNRAIPIGSFMKIKIFAFSPLTKVHSYLVLLIVALLASMVFYEFSFLVYPYQNATFTNRSGIKGCSKNKLKRLNGSIVLSQVLGSHHYQHDTTAPSLGFVPDGLGGGGGYYRSAVAVFLFGTDEGSGMAKIEYRLDGQGWVPGNQVLITTTGDHGLEGRATDKAGNVTHLGMAIHIDTIPPMATLASPYQCSTTVGQDGLFLGGKVSDIGSGIAEIEISFDAGNNWEPVHLVNETWRYGLDARLPFGSFCLATIRIKDIAGNIQNYVIHDLDAPK